MGRKNKRKPVFDGKRLFLYGRLSSKKAYGYCRFHCCYLSKKDLRDKNCVYKKCKHLVPIK